MICTLLNPTVREVFMKRRCHSLHLFSACHSSFRSFRRGICLHGHTQYSRESLGFLSHHVDAVPIAAQIARLAMARYKRDHGEDLDFNRAYWTAPLTAREAHELERKQIEESLGLEGIVSLTDHDNIDGLMEWPDEGSKPAASLEWTLPYPPAYVHLGVHNLPQARTQELTTRLAAYSTSPDETQLPELLAMLDAIPEVLLVLNHPFWEMESIGKAALLEMVHTFIRSYGRYIHALEVSGLRPWGENQQVLEMARDRAMAVVSGGDRHGWEASTMLNVTRAASFSEFVAEVRQEGRSEIVVMPDYHEPFGLRMMQVAWDVLREYPEHPCGRTHWMDRVFFQCDDGVVRPLSGCFKNGEPRELRVLTGAMRQLEYQPWRAVVRTAWKLQSKKDRLPAKRRTPRPAVRPAFSGGERSMA
jgi:hypothetical protein